jgi:hypothetical protein
MSEPASPYEIQPPSARRLLLSVVGAIVGAALVLVLFVLPAEYGIDPTGAGKALGLTQLSSSTRTIQLTDVTGGNEKIREVIVPDSGDPTPLPNPAVYQEASHAPRTQTLQVKLDVGQETEVKAVLKQAKVIVYSWTLDRGEVYVDFHGHNPEFGQKFFVRYEERADATRGDGSLVAPFAGEHGWFWQNNNDFPIVISLTVTGYYDDIVDYGLIGAP